MLYKSVVLFIFILLQSCYSFTGSSLDPRIQTISIEKFPNYALKQNPTLSQDFTIALQEVFSNRTSLTLTNDQDSDILIEGSIRDYNVTPVAIVSGDQAAKNRLTIRVEVIYQNSFDDKLSFTKTYSAFEDFNQTSNLSEVEDAIVPDINVRLVEQIFNDIIANW